MELNTLIAPVYIIHVTCRLTIICILTYVARGRGNAVANGIPNNEVLWVGNGTVGHDI